MRQTTIFLILVMVFMSCEKRNLSQILDKAERYAYKYNDSATILLENIDYHQLDEARLAQYYLIENHRNRFNEKREVCDSTLSISENYYRQKGDKKKLAEVVLLQGWGHCLREEYDMALHKFRESLCISKLINDSSLIARTYKEMSNVADRKDNKDSVFVLLHLALPYYRDLDRVHFYIHLADMYDLAEQTSKAIQYYRLAFKEAEPLDNRYINHTIRNRLIRIYTKNNMFKDAFQELDIFRQSRKGKYETSYGVFARAEIWFALHQYDSAFHYYKIASQSLNTQIAAEANARIVTLYDLKGDYRSGMYALQNFTELWESLSRNMEHKHSQAEYEEMKLKNELNEVKLAKRNREIYLLIFFLIVSLGSITTYIIYLRKKRDEERLRLKEQAEALAKENKLLKQAEELSALREKEAGLREALFKKMSVFHKIPSLETGYPKETEDKRIILSDKDWEELIQIVDSSYDNFAGRLKKQFPLLTAKDIQFCCLIKIHVTLKDLSDIYCVSKSAITKKKFRIKTEKLAFTDPYKSLDDFLEEF